MSGVYNLTPPTLQDGQKVEDQVDVNGRRLVVSGSSGATADQIQGNAAAGAADSGNPVKVGGRYNSTKPTLTDGQRGDAQTGARGSQIVQQALPDSASPVTSAAAGADAVSNTLNGYFGFGFGMAYNGTTWDRVPGNTVGAFVQGNVADHGTAAGNPVDIAGTYLPAYTPLTTGQHARLRMDSQGRVQVVLCLADNSAGIQADVNNVDAVAPNGAANKLQMLGQNYDFNGTNWDRHRANIDTAALVTATGATTTQTGADQTNYNGRGVQVVLDMTTVGTGSVTITIQGKDAASGKYYTLLAGAAVTTISTNVYTVFPGIAAAANVSANTVLPRTWRVLVTANNANPTTYTVGASIIV